MSIGAALALVATACDVGSPATPPGEGPTARVIEVIDGDSVRVETGDGVLEVRLAAINAPERSECWAEESTGQLASIAMGADSSLELIGVDQFGRALGHLFVGDAHVNHEMVAGGSALATTPDDGDPRSGELITAEDRAFESRTGLWGPSACGPPAASTVEIVGSRSTVDPRGPDEDALDAETIVIVNRGDSALDLSGWGLRDESSRHRFRFPDGSSIDAGSSIEVTSADRGWSPGGSPVWNNGGDMALLQDPSGNVVSRWRYGR